MSRGLVIKDLNLFVNGVWRLKRTAAEHEKQQHNIRLSSLIYEIMIWWLSRLLHLTCWSQTEGFLNGTVGDAISYSGIWGQWSPQSNNTSRAFNIKFRLFLMCRNYKAELWKLFYKVWSNNTRGGGLGGRSLHIYNRDRFNVLNHWPTRGSTSLVKGQHYIQWLE